MKRLLLLVLLFSTFVTFAQHKPFQFGFKAGLDIGWLATDTESYSNNGAKIGGSWGFIADFFLMEGYSFTTGFDVLYLNGSLNMPTEQGNGNTMVRDIKTRYVELPLIFTMKTKDIKEKFRIYGQVGFGLSFLLSAKATDQYTTSEDGNVSDTKNIYSELTATRESLILGAGFEIPIQGSTYIRTGIKFDNCFINILKGGDEKARNNFFEFNAAVLF